MPLPNLVPPGGQSIAVIEMVSGGRNGTMEGVMGRVLICIP